MLLTSCRYEYILVTTNLDCTIYENISDTKYTIEEIE